MSDSATRLLRGDSPAMLALHRSILKFGPTRLPVLIEGETGTGKELVAQALHVASGNRGRFVPFNVSAIPEPMFESTLFGHVRGAFTGATHSSDGFLAEADRGTAFFDEIGTMIVAVQSKLLRALETGAFRPVGANADRRSSFRIVSASNERLADRVADRTFRADLAQRLAGCVLWIPPLRERPDDIAPLADHFLAQSSTKPMRFSASAKEALRGYHWPGNVRELRMLVERLTVLSDNDVVIEQEVAEVLRGALGASRSAPGPLGARSRERELILETLRSAAGDTTQAASALGLHRSTLYRRMADLGLDASVRRGLRFEPASDVSRSQ